jgi:hypothetical protein
MVAPCPLIELVEIAGCLTRPFLWIGSGRKRAGRDRVILTGPLLVHVF